MARQARQQQNTSLFSIKQQSQVEIFRDKADRQAFVDILEKAQGKFNFNIYAFCLLDNDRFWLILDAKKRNIGKIMQSICISYALYRNDQPKLFKARYSSKPLYSTEELQNELNKLQSDPRYLTCSYCYFNPETKKPLDIIAEVDKRVKIEKTHYQTQSDSSAQSIIDKLIQESNLDITDVNQRNRLIKKIYAEYNLTQRQMAKYFDLSVSSISKITSM